MNSIFLSICAFILGIIWMASAPLKEFLVSYDYDVIPEDYILVGIIGTLFLIVIKNIHFLVSYTDEILPLYISLLGLALATGGVFVFTRLMVLGGLCLIAGAYWSRGTVMSYYR